MSKTKPKILWHTEASYVGSGFGTYAHEVLNRLYDTGKYELAEFANYGLVNHPQEKTRWKFYANAVAPNDPRTPTYNADPINVFGKWRFERVLTDFRPSICCSFLDPWMMNYQAQSPLRKYFHFVQMPTCDSAPQQNEWINTFNDADGILTYSDWAIDVFKKQSGGHMKVFKSAPPAINIDIFKPISNIGIHRANMGMLPDINLIGTIMRNQTRKLFPELFRSFKRFLEICEEKGRHDIAQKTFLLCHTSFPDMGWYLPQFLKETGLSHKIYFTYMCKQCNNVTFRFFQDARATCTKCKTANAIMPTVGQCLPHDELAKIYQMMDIYIQYAICEGFGMPSVEAASCGIPIMATDYSAMSDIVRKLNGIPIQLTKLYTELETHAFRAYPDNEHLAQELYKFFVQPTPIRQRFGMLARQGIEEHYTWNKTAKIWEEYFDQITLTGLQGKWDTPYVPVSPAKTIPEGLINNHVEYAEWLITKVLCEPELLHSYMHLAILQQLHYGAQIGIRMVSPLNPETFFHAFSQRTQNRDFWERVRCGIIQLPPEDYLIYANIKDKLYE